MKEQFTISGYNVTTDPDFQNVRWGTSPELKKQFETLFFEAQDKNNKKIIDKLTSLINQYPQSPQLKNYLSVAYSVKGKREKALEVNNWILTEHPDYLFGKLNQANKYIEEKQSEKVPSILGEAMELKALYPDRDLFHLAEVTGFYKVAVRYYASLDNLDLAENRLELLKAVAPEHPDAESAEDYLFALRMKKGAERWEEENKARITPVVQPKNNLNQTKQFPTFNHLSINYLYNNGLAIPAEKLREIIALPRATLIIDLENMLTDAENRYDYFAEEVYYDETHSFVLHALFLLNEIKATESLPKIISFLENDEEFLELWLGDHKTTTLWQCLYGLGFNDLEVLKQLLLKPGVDTYIKTSVTEALCQMVLHHPEKRNEVFLVYKDVFTKFNEANLEDNLIDSDFLGLAIGDAIDCNFKELLPVIKQLFQKKYVSIGINGNYIEVEEIFGSALERDKKEEIYSIVDLYKNILSTWSGYRDDKDHGDDFYDEDDAPLIMEPIRRTEPKTGRNEPCPCGSGNKYKKCHGISS